MTIAVLVAATGGAGLAGAGVLLRAEPVQRLARRQVTTLLSAVTGFEVRVQGVAGDVLRTLDLHGVRLRHDGQPVLDVDRLRIRWSPLALLAGRFHLREVALEQVRVRLVRTDAGWRLPSSGTRDEAGARTLPTVTVDRIRLRSGRLGLARLDGGAPRRVAIAALTLQGSLRISHGKLRLDLHRLTGTPRGIAVSPLRAHATITVTETGAVFVPGLTLRSARSAVRGRLQTATDGALRGRLGLYPLHRSELAALLPGVRLAASPRGVVAVTGTRTRLGVRAVVGLGDRGRLAAHGTLGLTAPIPSWRAMLLLDAFDPAVASPAIPPGRLVGRLVASGRGIASSTAGRYRLVLGRSTIDGHRIGALRLDGRVRGARHRLGLHTDIDGARARLHGAALLAPVLAWRARGEIAVSGLGALLPETSSTVRLGIRGRGRDSDPSTREAALRVTLAPSEILGVHLRRGRLDAALHGSVAEIRRLALTGPALLLEGEGRGDLETTAFRASLHARAELAAARLLSSSVAGLATLDTSVHGSFDALDGTTVVKISDLRTAALPPWQLVTDIRWNRVSGAETARFSVRGTGERGSRLDLDLGLQHAGRRVAVQIDGFSLALPGMPPWTLAAPASVRMAPGPLVDFPALTFVASGQRLAVHGRLGPADRIEAALVVDHLVLGPLCGAARLPSCAGTLRGRLRLRGTTASPLGDAHVEVPDLVVDGVRYGALVIDTEYASRRLRVVGTLDYPAAGRLEVAGTVPIDLGPTRPTAVPAAQAVSLRLRADSLDLRVLPALAPGIVRELDGRLTADVTLAGPLDRLVPAGVVELSAKRLVLRASGVPFRDLRARLRADTAGVELEHLALRGGDGRLEAHGRLTLRGGRPAELGGRFVFTDFLAVRIPAYEATVTGALDLGGTAEAPRIGGSLEVVRAIVRPGLLPADTSALAPDPTIEVLGRPGPAVAEVPATSDTLVGPLGLALRIRLARNAWIRLPDAQIELGGELTIDKGPWEDPRISGEILLRRGWYAFQGRRFTVDEGRFVLVGEYPPDPTVDVRATHRSGGYTVTLHLTGTLARPTLALASDPPLEQADVLAVLLFGRPTQELGAGEGLDLQRQALSLASSYVVPELQTSVMEALGLDTLEVGGEGVRAGRYVTRDVFIAISQQLGATPAQAVAVEYSLTRRLSLKASTTTAGQSAIDLEWRHRY